MNNKEFIARLAANTGHTQDVTQKFVLKVLKRLGDAVCEGDPVTIAGFGVFEVKKRLERVMLNPTTGKRMLVPPKLALTFKANRSARRQVTLHLDDDEAFVAALFRAINEGLDEDKQVKVKGLGTFKVVGVKARASVNVNTGERVVIDEHDKVTFTPETTMKELVNKPFAQFETVVLNDGVDFDAMGKQPEETPEEPRAEEKPLSEPTPEEPEAEEKPFPEPTPEEPEDVEEPIPNLTPDEPEADGPAADEEEITDEAVEEDNSRRRIWALIVLGLMLVAAVAGYFWYNQVQNEKPLPPLPKSKTVVRTPAANVKPATPQAVPAEKKVATTDSVAELLSTANKDPRVRIGGYDIVGIDTVVTLRAGQTMQSYCTHTLGKDMVVYFQALNGCDSMQAGDRMKVPKVQWRKKKQ